MGVAECMLPTQSQIRRDMETVATGKSASPGYAIGIIVPYQVGSKPSEMPKEPFILYSRMTTPEMLPWMVKAAGLVTQVGGITCHAAIVARELRIPCVVAIGEVTIPSGTRAWLDALDAKTGTVTWDVPEISPTISADGVAFVSGDTALWRGRRGKVLLSPLDDRVTVVFETDDPT